MDGFWAGHPTTRPSLSLAEGLGMTWKWTWSTSWWAMRPLFYVDKPPIDKHKRGYENRMRCEPEGGCSSRLQARELSSWQQEGRP